jgi:Methyltransferase domain
LSTEGWNLARLGTRIAIEPPPWNFDAIVIAHAARARRLLDIDTGGGEWLASLRERAPHTVATESWPPNFAVARERLRELAVDVVEAEPVSNNLRQGDDEPALPFANDSFDLVTARHAAFVAREVARVLVRGGAFLTQQVGGDYGDAYEALGLERPRSEPRWDLARAKEQLEAACLECGDGAEGHELTSFSDVGAFVWYLRQIPWTVENFSVERYRVNLERLHEQIEREGPLRLRLPAFWLSARKR